MRYAREILRRARQEKRLAEVRSNFVKSKMENLPIKSNPDGIRAYVIFGGNLMERLMQPPPQPMKRAVRAGNADSLRHSIIKKMEKDKQPPVSFSTVKRMAGEITRRAVKRLHKKSVM